MFKFITIRCKACGSVLYNIPDTTLMDFVPEKMICEDCFGHYQFNDFKFNKNQITQVAFLK